MIKQQQAKGMVHIVGVSLSDASYGGTLFKIMCFLLKISKQNRTQPITQPDERLLLCSV